MAKLNNLEAFRTTVDLILGDESLNAVYYGEDAGYEGGVFRTTQGLQKKYGKEKIFDAPIAEATLVGSACGMALAGMRPIVEIQFEGFSYTSLQQLFVHISRFRNRSRGRFTVPMVMVTPMGGGIRALEHHSEAIEAMWSHCPGLKVIIPSTPYDTKGLLMAAVKANDPVIFCLPSRLFWAFKQEVPDEAYTLKIGEAYTVKEGADLTIVTYATEVLTCQKAVAEYEKEHPEHSVEIIDLRTISDWDKATVIKSVKKTGRLLVVHQACHSFSVSSEITSTVSEECFIYLKAPAARETGYDIVIPFDKGEHYHQPTLKKIKAKIAKVINYEF